MTASSADLTDMTVHESHPHRRWGHAPAWWTVAAFASLALLVLAGLAGAVGIG